MFTAGTMDEAIIARKGIVKYEALAVKAKDYFILLKPAVDLKKLQTDLKSKGITATPSSTALKQIKSEAIMETSSMISGVKRHNSETPTLVL